MPYITTGKAARQCGVGINTMKRWIQKGELTCVITPGGHWRIPKDEFERFLNKLHETEKIASPVYKVLLIEDDPEMTALIEGAFELADFELQFQCESDGYAGLMAVGSMQPDLILLDIMLPEINGLELIQRIRGSDLCRDVKIVVITGAGDRRLVKKALDKAAPEAVFFKPFQIKELVNTVAILLQKKSLQVRAS